MFYLRLWCFFNLRMSTSGMASYSKYNLENSFILFLYVPIAINYASVSYHACYEKLSKGEHKLIYEL